jgi:acetyl esterase/lipase
LHANAATYPKPGWRSERLGFCGQALAPDDTRARRPDAHGALAFGTGRQRGRLQTFEERELRASDEQLARLPPAFLIVDEPTRSATRARPTRRSCREAGNAVTTVRSDGITHDFMMLNSLSAHAHDPGRGRPGDRRPA